MISLVVLVNGAFAPSAPPPRMLFGHVVVPVAALAQRIADRVTREGPGIVLTRGRTVCALRLGSAAYRCSGVARTADVLPFATGGTVFVPLADVVAGLGGSVTFDARAGVVAVVMPPVRALVTPAPFDPLVPQVVPTQVFTPQPPPATPRALDTGEPRPRRTAIPVSPSRVPTL